MTEINKDLSQEQEDLLCCPFCGEGATVYPESRGEDLLDNVWVVGCTVCPCEMSGDDTSDYNAWYQANHPDEKQITITAWNRRIKPGDQT